MTLVDRHGAPLRTCASPGCSRRAEVYPEVIIPPRGYPIDRGLKTQVGIPLCKRHGHDERPESFLTESFREMASAMVRSSPIPLDFERAVVKLRPLGDVEWRRFEADAKKMRDDRSRSVH